MDGFYSIFDGLPVLNVPLNPVIAHAPVRIDQSSPISTFLGATTEQVGSEIRDLIIAKAKLANHITEKLVKRYHETFMKLYKSAQCTIEELENELFRYKNPARNIVTVIDFKPKDAEVNPVMVQYIIRAMAEGVDLMSILPDHLKTAPC